VIVFSNSPSCKGKGAVLGTIKKAVAMFWWQTTRQSRILAVFVGLLTSRGLHADRTIEGLGAATDQDRLRVAGQNEKGSEKGKIFD